MPFGFIKTVLGKTIKSTFSQALIDVFEGRAGYICDECGGKMEFEDENESILICTQCNRSMELEHYGLTDEEYYDVYGDNRGWNDEDKDDDDDEDDLWDND